MDRLLSSDAYLNLRFRLGLEIRFGHLIRSFLLVLALKFVIRKPDLYLELAFYNHYINQHCHPFVVELAYQNFRQTNLTKVNS